MYILFLILVIVGFLIVVVKLVLEKVVIGNFKGVNKIFKVLYIVLFIIGIILFCILFFGVDYIVINVMKNLGVLYFMKVIVLVLLFVFVMFVYRGYF